jgi:hypothetical protein
MAAAIRAARGGASPQRAEGGCAADPEFQSTEISEARGEKRGHHKPKAEAEVPEVRTAPDAGRAAQPNFVILISTAPNNSLPVINLL